MNSQLPTTRGRLDIDPITAALTNFPNRMYHPTTPATSAVCRHSTAECRRDEESHRRPTIRDRMGWGLPATVLGTMPMTDTHAALCCLTPPALRTAWRGESSPGPCRLRINEQDQQLPPSLGYPLLGSCSLGTRARRAPHDGPACRRTNQFIRVQVQWHPASGRTVILEPI